MELQLRQLPRGARRSAGLYPAHAILAGRQRDGRDWVLLNASPDLRQQIAASPSWPPRRKTACAPARSRRRC